MTEEAAMGHAKRAEPLQLKVKALHLPSLPPLKGRAAPKSWDLNLLFVL